MPLLERVFHLRALVARAFRLPRIWRRQENVAVLERYSTKHPARSDFHTVVTEAGITVTFKPTNSIYSFYRLAGSNEIARIGPVSYAGVQHAGHNTEDYPADEVQNLAQRIASELAASIWPVQDNKAADEQTLVTPDYRKLQQD
jgi:hypothetical protein